MCNVVNGTFSGEKFEFCSFCQVDRNELRTLNFVDLYHYLEKIANV